MALSLIDHINTAVEEVKAEETKSSKRKSKAEAEPKPNDNAALAELAVQTTAEQIASEFEVFSDIPIPDGKAEREAKYPFRKLEVGQSFFVPGAKVSTFNTLCSSWSKKLERRYIARKWTGKNGVEGVMVWRKS